MKLQSVITILCILSNFTYSQASQNICPSPLPEKYQDLQSGAMVSAYVANWDMYGAQSYKIEDIHKIAHKLTHVIYAFMKPDDVKGACHPHDLWADIGAVDDFQSKVGGNFAKLRELKRKHPHLKILLSVGGGTYNKKFITLAQDPKLLKKFAQSCVDMLDFYDHTFQHFQDKSKQTTHFTYKNIFDGLDIDWEWDAGVLNSRLSDAFTSFIHELRRLLDIRKKQTKQGALLSVALQVTPSIYKNLDLKAIAQDINWFHVMAYDFFGPHNENIGFNAPICSTWSVYSIDGAVQRIMEQGVSPAKMVLCVPLYGYLYENTDGYNAKIDKKNKSKAVSYKIIKTKYLNNAQFQKKWDDFSHVPFLHNEKKRIFISYDEQESIIKKVEFAQDKKMQGVVVWRLSGDDDENTMMHTIADAIKR